MPRTFETIACALALGALSLSNPARSATPGKVIRVLAAGELDHSATGHYPVVPRSLVRLSQEPYIRYGLLARQQPYRSQTDLVALRREAAVRGFEPGPRSLDPKLSDALKRHTAQLEGAIDPIKDGVHQIGGDVVQSMDAFGRAAVAKYLKKQLVRDLGKEWRKAADERYLPRATVALRRETRAALSDTIAKLVSTSNRDLARELFDLDDESARVVAHYVRGEMIAHSPNLADMASALRTFDNAKKSGASSAGLWEKVMSAAARNGLMTPEALREHFYGD